jgi:hypothetical protein
MLVEEAGAKEYTLNENRGNNDKEATKVEAISLGVVAAHLIFFGLVINHERRQCAVQRKVYYRSPLCASRLRIHERKRKRLQPGLV